MSGHLFETNVNLADMFVDRTWGPESGGELSSDQSVGQWALVKLCEVLE